MCFTAFLWHSLAIYQTDYLEGEAGIPDYGISESTMLLNFSPLVCVRAHPRLLQTVEAVLLGVAHRGLNSKREIIVAI